MNDYTPDPSCPWTSHLRYILLTGNIGDGLEAVGPFASQEAAIEWAEAEGVEYILMDIYTPNEGEE